MPSSGVVLANWFLWNNWDKHRFIIGSLIQLFVNKFRQKLASLNHSKRNVSFGSALIWRVCLLLARVIFVIDGLITVCYSNPDWNIPFILAYKTISFGQNLNHSFTIRLIRESSKRTIFFFPFFPYLSSKLSNNFKLCISTSERVLCMPIAGWFFLEF